MLLEAVCGCNTGKIRKNNEDNLFFNGRWLMQTNNGIANTFSAKIDTAWLSLFSVYDGMGGEACGEVASYIAASGTDKYLQATEKQIVPADKLLNGLAESLNSAIFNYSVQNTTGRMGSTMAAMLFKGREFYTCNVGDSRLFQLRKNKFSQISTDDLELLPVGSTAKPRLTQHLGMDPTEIALEPHISKGELQKDDVYLLCSDGVTDMLSNEEIVDILRKHKSTKAALEATINAAMTNGGRDNITAIIIRVK